MNAVNLIPSDHRRRRTSLSASPATLGLIGGLVVVLAAAVLYVFAVNDVRSRQSELARVTANAASWQAAANSYTSYVTAAQQRKQQETDVRELASGRFPWSLLLSQIGGLMPADAALSSLSATSPSTDSTAAAPPAGTSPSTPSSASPVQVSGCAASQSAVAATMVALRRVHGVGSVDLASTSNSGAASSGSGSSSGQGGSGGGCPFPVSFQMSLQLTSAGSTTTSGAATPPSTPAAAPTASTASTSTGAAQ